ncbi:MAG: hypothetical protein DDT29_01104 [Dehalococcoidia bacterium]|nr:hypothetical protein [Bacillota bacterium]
MVKLSNPTYVASLLAQQGIRLKKNGDKIF